MKQVLWRPLNLGYGRSTREKSGRDVKHVLFREHLQPSTPCRTRRGSGPHSKKSSPSKLLIRSH